MIRKNEYTCRWQIDFWHVNVTSWSECATLMEVE